MIPADRIRDEADALFDEAVRTRRHLHMSPELSFNETETSAFIAAELERAGIPHETGIGGNGIAATIAGSGDGVVALRADMDALPIQEANDHAYRSRNDGAMHA